MQSTHSPGAGSVARHSLEETLWHTFSAEHVVTRLSTHISHGLRPEDAEARLTEFGINQLTEAKRTSPWMLLVEQFKNVLIIILLVAVGLSAFLGHGIEAAAIGVIVLFAVLLGFVQEYRAERAIEALRSMSAPTATVLRGGEEL